MVRKLLAFSATPLFLFGSIGTAGASDLFGGATELVSINHSGTDSGNGESSDSPLLTTPDGRFIGFISEASDLVETDTNEEKDIFVRDLKRGITVLVSISQAGTDSGNDSSGAPYAESVAGPVISANGRVVAFLSEASDLVATDTNNQSGAVLCKAKCRK